MARRMILTKEIGTDVVRSAARVLQNPTDVSRHGTDGTTAQDGNTAIGSDRLTSPVRIYGSTTDSPNRTGNQDIISPRGAIGPQWSSDADPLDASIRVFPAKYRDPTPIFSKLIGRKFTNKFSTDFNSRCQMNFGSDAVLIESPYFVNLGLTSMHTSNELGSVFVPTTGIGTPTDGSNWILVSHSIGEVAADR